MAIDTRGARPVPRAAAGALPAGVAYETWILGALICVYCWLFAPATADLAAAVFRSDLFDTNGVLIYNAQWYSGHHLPAYSLLSPPLGALLGTRLLAALSTFGAIVAFERIVVPRYGTSGRVGAALFAVTAGSSLLIGRVAFAVGLFFGVLAVYFMVRNRFVLACVAAVGAALGSPLAGFFLAMIAGVWFLATRRLWGVAIAAAAVAPSLALSFAFREGGTFPYGWISFLQLVLFCLLFLLALPRDEKVVRWITVAYLFVGLYAQLVPSQLGGNVNRLGTIVGAPLLAALLWERRRLMLLIALPYLLWWPIHSVIRDLPDAGGAITESSYYRPLNVAIARAQRAAGEPARVEIPPTRNHWEGVYVGKHFELARGWERQLDQKFANLFYGTVITPENYYKWLRRNAVSYVAVMDGAADFAGRSEADFLIQHTPSYLREVWRNENWVLYAVDRPTPLLSGPGRLVETTADSFTFDAERTGRFVMRLHYSQYWAVTVGSGCVAPARGNFTEITVRRPGRVKVGMSFSPIRVVRQGRRCS
ncbi:MAG TPA: hypothetical protein VJT75_19925 [Thermoleophilaceae bacterium]|nr:hypothetical protein [Thermoleophilaceae bacterium]